jgi:hypothetical protein
VVSPNGYAPFFAAAPKGEEWLVSLRGFCWQDKIIFDLKGIDIMEKFE